MEKGRVWSIVLAAGEGKRLSDIARDEAGNPLPKQFWAFDGKRSLLRATLDRMEPLIPAERTLPVVAEHHARWWTKELAGMGSDNIVVQPSNRGTAAGILLPLLRILGQDPASTLVVVPSDHYVEKEGALRGAIADALAVVERCPERIALLGMVPERPDPQYGWIVPAERHAGSALSPVAGFVEKPDARTAQQLLRRGAVVNSLIFVTRAATLLHLFDLTLPRLVGALLDQGDGPFPRSLTNVYRGLPEYDFSRDVLESCAEYLSVLIVPDCGWTDVGNTERLARLRLRTRANRRHVVPRRLPAREYPSGP